MSNIPISGVRPHVGNGSNTFRGIHDFIEAHKRKINIAANGGAAIFNALTFVEGNWGFTGTNIELMERASSILSKFATGTQGILGAVDNLTKENLIPLIGNALEVPIAIFASGYNLWLARGLSQGWVQMQGVFKQRLLETTDGVKKLLGDDFSKRGGWMFGANTNIKELPKIIKEIFTKPFSREQGFSRGVFACSSFQMFGALTSFLGFEKLGAGIRDFSGSMVDFAFMLDKNYVPAGIVWVGAAIVDFIKRFTDRIPNLTELSLFFDRAASVFFMFANFAADEDKSKIITYNELKALQNKAQPPLRKAA